MYGNYGNYSSLLWAHVVVIIAEIEQIIQNK